MKEFLKKYGYTAVKMFVYQIAFAMFGWALATASIPTENYALKLVTSIFSILFYLVLVYIIVWNEGARDRVSADYNKIPRRPWLGAVIGAVGSIPNIILFVLIALGHLIPSLEGFSGVCELIALFVEGVYVGILSIQVGGNPLRTYWLSYLVIILPLIVTSFLAYFAGFHNFRIFPQDKKQK